MTAYLNRMNRPVRFRKLQERATKFFLSHFEDICTLIIMVGAVCIVALFWGVMLSPLYMSKFYGS